MKHFIILLIAATFTISVDAQKKSPVHAADLLKKEAAASIQADYEIYKKAALQIWDYAEVGYKEIKSSALLQNMLQQNGFTVEAGIAGMPTAFVASYGSGKPVIALLAEFDALPGLSQTTAPEKISAGKEAGHGCGHHLFGVGSAAAGIAIKKLMEEKKLTGTIKVFGCPAEEGGSGKVYMVRAGLFKDADVAIHWHPEQSNSVIMTSALANISAKFRFYGTAAHAAAAPDRGRSALDAVEAMNYMVNMMREHIPQETRIHYVITNGGKAPNVVPDFAEVYYYVRHPNRKQAQNIFNRVADAAKGSALGTDTRTDYEIIGGTHDLLLNNTLAAIMQTNLQQTGGIVYTDAELAYGKKIQATFNDIFPLLSSAAVVEPLKTQPDAGGGSTDVGDVSYAVPVVGLHTATWIPGTSAHSWQAVSCGAADIGIKAMLVAAKTMTATAIDLLMQPGLIEKATVEFKQAKGNYEYKALLGDRKPALNYRD